MDAARIAGRILRTMEMADSARLEFELACAAGGRQVSEDERGELLEAVACGMRNAISRMRRGLAPRIEGAEVHVALLRHLAAGAQPRKSGPAILNDYRLKPVGCVAHALCVPRRHSWRCLGAGGQRVRKGAHTWSFYIFAR